MYDWANSSYNLVITSTIFPAYYVAITSSKVSSDLSYVNFFGLKIINTALQNYTLAVVFLLVAILSPILSSIADYRGNKKSFMRFFTLMGATSCSALFFFTPDRIEYGMITFAIAALGFWSSLVFYNSYLPDIAFPQDRDRVSAKGFALGYIGSVILQIICFIVLLKPGLFGLDTTDKTIGARVSFLLVGLWWFGFAQITFKALPSNSMAIVAEGSSIYLMGLLTQQEAVIAKKVASNANGVKDVYAYFDIISEAEKTRLEKQGKADEAQPNSMPKQ